MKSTQELIMKTLYSVDLEVLDDELETLYSFPTDSKTIKGLGILNVEVTTPRP